MKTVAVVDYGMGNLRSVSQAVSRVAAEAGSDHAVVVTADPHAVDAADRVVLPGQGAIHDCMRELRESGLEGAVRAAAAMKPLMGVCIGMQMLLERSEEGPGGTPALGLIAGETEYGARFTCAVARDNIFATQFHPEQSADHGLALYRNFLRWNP